MNKKHEIHAAVAATPPSQAVSAAPSPRVCSDSGQKRDGGVAHTDGGDGAAATHLSIAADLS